MKDTPYRLVLLVVACLLLLGCASEKRDSAKGPNSADAPSADAPTPDTSAAAQGEPDANQANPASGQQGNAYRVDGLPTPSTVARLLPETAEPEVVMPEPMVPEASSPEAMIPEAETPEAMMPGARSQETMEPVLPATPTRGAIMRSTNTIPLQAPPLLSPDGDNSTPLTLRSFNPVRGEANVLGNSGHPDGIRFETSLSASTPKMAMTLPMVEAPEAEPVTSLPDTTFSVPGLSLQGGSVPKDDPVLVLAPNTAQPASVAPAVSPELPGGAEPPAPPTTAQASSPSDVESAAPASKPESADPYTVVRVFYGTDRNAIVDSVRKPSFPLGWGVSTVFVAMVTVLLGMAALRLRRNPSLRWAALGSLVCTFLFAGVTLAVRLQSEPLTEAESAENPAASAKITYGNQRGTLEYGTCEVSIPKIHEIGQLEAPSIFRLDFHEAPERHVILAGIEPLESQAFFDGLKARVDQSDAKSAFVFVHGFNVTFEDAARRTAQIAYDLEFDGAPIFYSWPSQGGLFKYTIDETNVMWTVPHLRQFLTEVAERTQARRIHLVAHSMGNRALTSALRDLSFLPDDKRPRFSEVVLTAPDIDAEVFKKDIAPYIVQTADRVTLYASSNDTALAYSKTVHGYPRAGDSGQELLVLPGMETVDVSEVDTSLLGHNYYGDNETVLADLIEVLQKSMPPRQRRWLRSAQVGPLEYWVFQR